MPLLSRRRHRRHVRAHLSPLAAIFTNILSTVALRLLFGTVITRPSIFTHTPISRTSSFLRGQLHPGR